MLKKFLLNGPLQVCVAGSIASCSSQDLANSMKNEVESNVVKKDESTGPESAYQIHCKIKKLQEELLKKKDDIAKFKLDNKEKEVKNKTNGSKEVKNETNGSKEVKNETNGSKEVKNETNGSDMQLQLLDYTEERQKLENEIKRLDIKLSQQINSDKAREKDLKEKIKQAEEEGLSSILFKIDLLEMQINRYRLEEETLYEKYKAKQDKRVGLEDDLQELKMKLVPIKSIKSEQNNKKEEESDSTIQKESSEKSEATNVTKSAKNKKASKDTKKD